MFKGNDSDRIYYKAFFDIDVRVIDITNVILISSNKKMTLSNDYSGYETLKINIEAYIKDLQNLI